MHAYISRYLNNCKLWMQQSSEEEHNLPPCNWQSLPYDGWASRQLASSFHRHRSIFIKKQHIFIVWQTMDCSAETVSLAQLLCMMSYRICSSHQKIKARRQMVILDCLDCYSLAASDWRFRWVQRAQMTTAPYSALTPPDGVFVPGQLSWR